MDHNGSEKPDFYRSPAAIGTESRRTLRKQNLNIDSADNLFYKTMGNTASKQMLSKDCLSPMNADLKTSIQYKEAETLKPIETQIKNKLSYEWKNIFRCLSAADNEDMVELKEFDVICMKYNVNLTPEEFKRMKELYCNTEEGEDAPSIFNYRQFSYHLGLHKDSYNYMNTSVINSSRASKSVFKIKNSLLAQSRVNEEDEDQFDLMSKTTN